MLYYVWLWFLGHWSVFCVSVAGCCIYEKPKIFGQSSDEDDDDDHDCTDHCRGHKSKKDYRHDHDQGSPDPSQSNQHSDKAQSK